MYYISIIIVNLIFNYFKIKLLLFKWLFILINYLKIYYTTPLLRNIVILFHIHYTPYVIHYSVDRTLYKNYTMTVTLPTFVYYRLCLHPPDHKHQQCWCLVWCLASN